MYLYIIASVGDIILSNTMHRFYGHWLMNLPSTTSGAVTAYPFGAPEFTPGF